MEKSRLSTIAEIIRDHIALSGIDEYCRETGICEEDFVAIDPCEFEGEIFAIDGSNVVVCDWSTARVNKICAGYAVYRGTDWQRTVITYDDVFLADPEGYVKWFEPFLRDFFGLQDFSLKESELDRLSTYFRELQEYVALLEAIRDAKPGDLILYDGGFTWKERPLGDALSKVFGAAEEKGVDLMGVSKSSAMYWGSGISRPLVQHTSFAGSIFAQETPWYISLKGKKVKPETNWGGNTFIARLDGCSEMAFRVDVPSYLVDRAGSAIGKLALYSCSAECPGYPHALFRAHRDVRITDEEGTFLRLKLMDVLCNMGLGEPQVRTMMQDYHDVLEMRPRI